MTNRRHFLTRGAAAAVGLLGLSTVADRAHGLQPAKPDHEAWLDRLAGDDRQLFDSPEPSEGRMLHLILHYLDTYRRAYDAPDGAAAAAGTFYGGTTAFAFRDEIWSRYGLGNVARIPQPAGGHPTARNPWRVDPVIGGKIVASAGIEALQARGTVFLVCHAALIGLARRIAESSGAEAPAVQTGLEGGILPGVVLVPSVVIAIQRAQKRGVSYYRIG